MANISRIGSLTLATALATALSVGTLSANSIGTITIDNSPYDLGSLSVSTNSDGSLTVFVTTLEGGSGGNGDSYLVTASAGTGGSISPTSVNVAEGNTTSFSVSAHSGYSIGSVSGCGGSLSGSTFTTGAITASCTVTASFNALSNDEPAPDGVDIIRTYDWSKSMSISTENLGHRTSAYRFTTTSHGSPRWGQLSTGVTSLNPSTRTVWISKEPGGQPLDHGNALQRCAVTGHESASLYWSQYPRDYFCSLERNQTYYFNVRNARTWNGDSVCGASNCRFYLGNQVYN